MRRILSTGAAALLIGATACAGGAARDASAAATTMASYSGTLLAPLDKMHKVAGAVALSPAGNGEYKVSVIVSGLEPNSTHAEHIHVGSSCSANGPIKYPLPTLHADAAGDASATGMVMTASLPAKGFYVNIHATNGTPIACGVLHNPTMVVSVKPMGGIASATVLISEPAPVMGNRVKTGTEVLVMASGLKPGTAYPNHIHAAVCGVPSPIMYPLNTLVGDSQGNGFNGTGITDIVPVSGLSVHIHNTSFKMIACGNIGSSMPAM